MHMIYLLTPLAIHSLIAHQFAFEVGKILHRDVSFGNIMILANGEGILIDWEMSMRTTGLQRSRRKDRSVS